MATEDNYIIKLTKFLHNRFDLSITPTDKFETIDDIKKSVDFKGLNLWVLVLAIFIASLGLNTNSTAVIIGAMLISPLMGPIMGIGLAMGVTDFELMKRAFKSYALATFISLATSTIFFLLSPMNIAGSELLARTTPTVYDVLIALFGGMAGIIAIASREKGGNVIAGVAIATALMPPLCTAGYGLASGNFAYFAGAFYLYFINSVFISWATFLGARFLRFPRKTFVNPKREKVVTRYISLIVICTLIPSVYFAYNIIRESLFINNAEKFISEELKFPDTQIVNKNIIGKRTNKSIEVFLIGKDVPQSSIDLALSKMERYGLGKATLTVKQNVKGEEIDAIALKAMVLEDIYKNTEQRMLEQQTKIDELNKSLQRYTSFDSMGVEIAPEIKAVFPFITKIALSTMVNTEIENLNTETSLLALVNVSRSITKDERTTLEAWLKARVKTESIILLLEERDENKHNK